MYKKMDWKKRGDIVYISCNYKTSPPCNSPLHTWNMHTCTQLIGTQPYAFVHHLVSSPSTVIALNWLSQFNQHCSSQLITPHLFQKTNTVSLTQLLREKALLGDFWFTGSLVNNKSVWQEGAPTIITGNQLALGCCPSCFI